MCLLRSLQRGNRSEYQDFRVVIMIFMFSFQLLVVKEYTISKLTSKFWLKFIYSWVKTSTEVGLISKSHYIKNCGSSKTADLLQ